MKEKNNQGALQERREQRQIIRTVSKRNFYRGMRITLAVELIIVLVVFMAVGVCKRYSPKVQNGHLIRNFSDIIKHLPDEPEDIESIPYQSQIPDFIREDIDKMLKNTDIQDIIYQSKDGLTKVVISESDDGLIMVNSYDYHNLTNTHGPIISNISFYKTEYGFSIYGRDNLGKRQIVYYQVSEEHVIDGIFVDSSIDLFGVGSLKNKNYLDDYRYIWSDNSFLTLLRDGNEFAFYSKGEKCDETVMFPGADIVNCNHQYIIDSNNDMYYMYYCADPDNPWVHFEKVAESIDEVTGEYVKADYYLQDYGEPSYKRISYPIYAKDGKSYVAVPDFETEMAYGQSYGEKRDVANAVEPDYSIETIEIDK